MSGDSIVKIKCPYSIRSMDLKDLKIKTLPYLNTDGTFNKNHHYSTIKFGSSWKLLKSSIVNFSIQRQGLFIFTIVRVQNLKTQKMENSLKNNFILYNYWLLRVGIYPPQSLKITKRRRRWKMTKKRLL